MTTRTRPAGCPRLVDGGVGPRACWYVDACPYHNSFGRRLGVTSREASRATVALEIGDDCALDVAARTELAGEPMPIRLIALRSGHTKRQVGRWADLGIRKIAEALGEEDPKEVIRALVYVLTRR